MAKRKRSSRGFGRPKRRSRKKGFMGGFKVYDAGQILYNLDGLGYIAAGQAVVGGDFVGAKDRVIDGMQPANTIPVAIGNIWIGLSRKMIHATGSRWTRRIIA